MTADRNEPDELNPKILAAALEIQRYLTLQSATGTFNIRITANQGGVTSARPYREETLTH